MNYRERLFAIKRENEEAARAVNPQPSPFICPLCRRRSYHPEDTRNRYCVCCGNTGLPKLCEHRRARMVGPLP